MSERSQEEINWLNRHRLGNGAPNRKMRRYSLESVATISSHGIPCPSCLGFHDNGVVNLLSNCRIQDSRQRVYCCGTCQGLLCDTCGQGFRTIREWGSENIAQCAWCAEIMQYEMFLLSSEQRSEFFAPYRQAEQGVLHLKHWQWKMWNKHCRKFISDKMYWGECVVQKRGWRFFIDFKRLVTNVHEAQYRLFVSNMMQNSISSLLNFFEKRFLQSKMFALMNDFYKLDVNDQFVYLTPRKLISVHSFSVTMLRGIPSKFFTIVMNRLCANMAEKMARGLGIVG